ncbi:hypothetical protein LB505_012458 [Fusarium chuoi]|nr:hypothetical protein LB505_012458 [Fusarium chuoi]
MSISSCPVSGSVGGECPVGGGSSRSGQTRRGCAFSAAAQPGDLHAAFDRTKDDQRTPLRRLSLPRRSRFRQEPTRTRCHERKRPRSSRHRPRRTSTTSSPARSRDRSTDWMARWIPQRRARLLPARLRRTHRCACKITGPYLV